MHHPDTQPMHRRERFNFDTFESDITKGLKDALETSLGHSMIAGVMQAEDALEVLDYYDSEPPEAA